jgi:hypothetical protein
MRLSNGPGKMPMAPSVWKRRLNMLAKDNVTTATIVETLHQYACFESGVEMMRGCGV